MVKAQADVEAAKQAEDAAQMLDSRKKLLEQGALARKLVDEAQVAYAQAHSQLLAAQEHLRALQSVGKQEQIKTAAAQVEAARSHLQSLEAQLAYSRDPQPDFRRDRRPPALRRRDGEARHAAAHRDGHLEGGGARQRSAEPGGPDRSDSPRSSRSRTATSELQGKVTVVSPATDPQHTTVQVWIESTIRASG